MIVAVAAIDLVHERDGAHEQIEFQLIRTNE